MYSSKEYQQVAKDNIDYLDILFKNSKNKNLSKLKSNFKKSTILERNFWDCFVYISNSSGASGYFSLHSFS